MVASMESPNFTRKHSLDHLIRHAGRYIDNAMLCLWAFLARKKPVVLESTQTLHCTYMGLNFGSFISPCANY